MNPPAPASQVLGLQAYPTTLSSHNLILLGKLRPEQQAEHLALSTDLGAPGFLCALVISIAVRKHQDQSNLGGGEVISAVRPSPRMSSSKKKTRAGTQDRSWSRKGKRRP